MKSFERQTGGAVFQSVQHRSVRPLLRRRLGFEMTKKWIDEGKLRWCWLQQAVRP
jgi:hypothetical protein